VLGKSDSSSSRLNCKLTNRAAKYTNHETELEIQGLFFVLDLFQRSEQFDETMATQTSNFLNILNAISQKNASCIKAVKIARNRRQAKDGQRKI